MARRLNNQGFGAYGTPNGISNVFPAPVVAQRSPATTDIGYPIGQKWINTVTNQSWDMTSVAGGSATWALSSPGASDVDTINSLSPVAGDIVIAGGTNITDVNGGNTVTLNLDPAITLATSVTSPLYTSGAGVDVQITAPAGQNIILQMGDGAGANKVSFTDSTAVEVFAIDSNGTFGALAGLTVTGAFTQIAGVVNVGQDNAANAINIGGGTTARAIGIGNTAAPHVLTLGSTNTTAQTILQSGTVGLSETSTGPITIDSAGVLELNSSAGVIGIGNDAVAQNINVGTGAAQRVITVGNITNATAVNINTGTAGTTHTTTNGIYTLNTGTGQISLGTDAAQKNIVIGNVTGTTSVNVNSGTGACAWTTTNGSFGLVTGTGAINLGADAAQKNIIIGNATGTTSVVVNGGTGAMQFGANAIAHDTTLGSVTGANTTTLQSGTTGLVQTSTGPVTIDSAGVLELNSSAGVIGIGNDAVNQNINVGTAGVRTVTVGSGTGASSTVVNSGTGAASFGANATDHTTTIGSTTGVSATVIQSGTGDITVTGTVKQLDAEFVTRSGIDITCSSSPIVQSNANTGAAPTGATGDVNLLMFQEGFVLREFVKGAGQTIIAPRADATGLLVSGDLTATEGYEINADASRANAPLSFTIGTSAAFYAEMQFTVADVSGCEPMYFGFRKTQADNANYTAYTDFVGYGLNNAVAGGDCVIATNLNSGGVNTTDTNDAWADGASHTLQVLVSAAGVVTFTFDGAPPTVTQAFTFDNGDVVHFWYTHVFGAAAPGAIHWNSIKVGYQA